MTVRVYRHDDASAPILTGNATDYKIIDVLDKCLVAGYGSKSAAGWTKSYTGTGKASFRSGTGSNQMYLRVDCSVSSQTPRVRGFETMSDVDTGTGPFPTDAQISGGGYYYISSTTDTVARPWMIIATEKAFYLIIGHGITAATGMGSLSLYQAYFFGDITSYKVSDAYNTAIICSNANLNSSSGFAHLSAIVTPVIGSYIARSHTQTGGSVAVGKNGDYRCTNSTFLGSGTAAYPDPVTGGMLMSPIFIHESAISAVRGIMPGLWAPLHNNPGTPADTFSGTGSLSGKAFILLNCPYSTNIGRAIFETSDTW